QSAQADGPGDQGEPSVTIFLCHASNDKKAVRNLHGDLRRAGFRPWLDEVDLLPGKEWEPEIKHVVRHSDIVLVCLSRSSIAKTGFVQKEIRYALDVADEKPEGTIYVIPVRLEERDIPNRLAKWHGVNLYERDGFDKLNRAIKSKAKKRV
ncbi:MAG TPA: toll/interleukin-1 receptor domain-containing protein, partial [Bryobacteraceae bacterium]|nr:toll/interleukin-1 receptor domain-containing protein [Bryobacteraceae bacterium]